MLNLSRLVLINIILSTGIANSVNASDFKKSRNFIPKTCYYSDPQKSLYYMCNDQFNPNLYFNNEQFMKDDNIKVLQQQIEQKDLIINELISVNNSLHQQINNLKNPKILNNNYEIPPQFSSNFNEENIKNNNDFIPNISINNIKIKENNNINIINNESNSINTIEENMPTDNIKINESNILETNDENNADIMYNTTNIIENNNEITANTKDNTVNINHEKSNNVLKNKKKIKMSNNNLNSDIPYGLTISKANKKQRRKTKKDKDNNNTEINNNIKENNNKVLEQNNINIDKNLEQNNVNPIEIKDNINKNSIEINTNTNKNSVESNDTKYTQDINNIEKDNTNSNKIVENNNVNINNNSIEKIANNNKISIETSTNNNKIINETTEYADNSGKELSTNNSNNIDEAVINNNENAIEEFKNNNDTNNNIAEIESKTIIKTANNIDKLDNRSILNINNNTKETNSQNIIQINNNTGTLNLNDKSNKPTGNKNKKKKKKNKGNTELTNYKKKEDDDCLNVALQYEANKLQEDIKKLTKIAKLIEEQARDFGFSIGGINYENSSDNKSDNINRLTELYQDAINHNSLIYEILLKNNKFKTKKEKFEVLLALTIGKVNSYNTNLFHINSHPLFKNINNNNVFIQVDIPDSNNKNSAKCNTTYIKKDWKNFRSKELGKIKKTKNINIIVTNDIASTQKELANAITNNLYKKQDNWNQWVNTQVDSISQEEIDQKLFEAYCCNANIINNNTWDEKIMSACNTIKPMILDIPENNISYTLKDFIDKVFTKLKHTIDSDDILTNNDKEIVVQELLKYLIMQINCYDTLKSLLDDCIDNNPVINNNMEETNSTTSIDNIDNNNKIITNKLKNNNAMWQSAPNKSYAIQEMKQIVDNNRTLQNDVNKSNISIINNQLDEDKDKDIEQLLINSVLQIIEIIKQPDITCNKLYNKILHIIIGTRKKLYEFYYETLDVHNDVFQSYKKNILQLLRNNTLINNFTKDILNGKFVLGTKITRDTVNSLKTQELKEIFEEINNNQSTIYKKPEEELYIDDYK